MKIIKKQYQWWRLFWKIVNSCKQQGADSIQIWHLTSIGNPIVEIRRSYDRLISTMGFPKLVRWHLYIESGPRWFESLALLPDRLFCRVCINLLEQIHINYFSYLSTFLFPSSFSSWTEYALPFAIDESFAIKIHRTAIVHYAVHTTIFLPAHQDPLCNRMVSKQHHDWGRDK